jgi:hypothetical protein
MSGDKYVITLYRGRSWPWSLGWYGNYTYYSYEGAVLGISPEHGWWRVTKPLTERAVRRQIDKDKRWRNSERIEVIP